MNKPLFQSIGLLILRVGIGGYLATHGWGKLQMLIDGVEFQGDPLRLGTTVTHYLAVFAEFVCSLLVVAGVFTRFAAIPPIATMLTAAFVVHIDDPWTMGEGASKEPALLFLTGFLAIFFLGAGRFSFDHWWRSRRAS